MSDTLMDERFQVNKNKAQLMALLTTDLEDYYKKMVC